MYKAIIALVAVLAVAQASPVAHPEPVALEARDNPLAKCLKNPDGSQWFPTIPNSVCKQAFTDPGYSYGTERVPFGQDFVVKAVSPTSGPMHCCSRCERDAKCIGWQIDDNCDCSTWTTTVSCPPAPGTFGVVGTAQSNVTGIYHVSPSNCNA